MEYRNAKLQAAFALPEDISQRQFEQFESRAAELLNQVTEGKGKVTPSLVSRATVQAAIEAGFVKNVDGCPDTVDALPGARARVLWWMSDTIAKYIRLLKTIDPN